MALFRKLLLPFSALYWLITSLRNYFYTNAFFKSQTFPIPIIAVGNLTTGGTGKTPQIEYLVRLLSQYYRVATLSRGYKRKSKGFVLAGAGTDAAVLGDEPYQFYQKFPDITVAVDANRKNGIEQLLSLSLPPEIVLLDDAYQHRRVKAGFYILLTAYGDLYTDDFLLPAGNLRESRTGAKRADIIIVTKCPPGLSQGEQEAIERKLKAEANQKIYFTFIEYDNLLYSEAGTMTVEDAGKTRKLLLAGIAKPEPFFRYLKSPGDEQMAFLDHHYFSDKEIGDIRKKSQNKFIITTEKDYMRLKGRLPDDRLFYLPIKSTFIKGSDDFDKTILDYVGKSTGNR